jgi:predicted transcriptional regulator
MNERLKDILTRAETWPDYAQEELAAIASDIEAELKRGIYHPTAEERAGIERGLRDAAQGRFATDTEMEQVFAKIGSK